MWSSVRIEVRRKLIRSVYGVYEGFPSLKVPTSSAVLALASMELIAETVSIKLVAEVVELESEVVVKEMAAVAEAEAYNCMSS